MLRGCGKQWVNARSRARCIGSLSARARARVFTTVVIKARNSRSGRVDRQKVEDAFARLLAESDQSAPHPTSIDTEELTEGRKRGDGVGVRAKDPTLDLSIGEARDVPVQHLATVGLDTIGVHCPKQTELT